MPYPGRTAPAHIHVTIKEPDRNEYWIDEYVFDDDPLLTKEHRDEMKNHGGNGVLLVHTVEKDFQKASRNIYLGKNIQDYK
jgi:protocatechuate 3,4-dioxygenase beta subunit